MMGDWRDREAEGRESGRIRAEAWFIGALMAIGFATWCFDALR